jgi:calcineurin-like phosphoesterase family protein
MIEIAGQSVLLNHMPYREEIAEYQPTNNGKPPILKYMDFRPKDKDLWLLHGHVHEKWKIRDRMINVGVDVWDFFPVSIIEIEKILLNKVEN